MFENADRKEKIERIFPKNPHGWHPAEARLPPGAGAEPSPGGEELFSESCAGGPGMIQSRGEEPTD